MQKLGIELDMFTLISSLSIVVMFIAFWKAWDYKSSVPGGVVGKTWNLIITLVTFFFFGYLSTPFFVMLPQAWKDYIVAMIFFFGAVYVLVTIRLVYKIIMVMKGE